MTSLDWVEEFPGAITVCDPTGIILAINAKAAQGFAAEGGKALLGSNVLACHPEPARAHLQQMLETQQANVYTIEKNGAHKLIYQTPWYQDGAYAGFVELSLVLPTALATLPHFVRTPKVE